MTQKDAQQTHHHNDDHHDHNHDHNHDHGHSHSRGHSHAHHAPQSFNLAFALAVSLNFGFVLIETFYALMANSMGLLADAAHNFGDVFGLLLAWAPIGY
jgi:cobalt-zinc-cadmium efflux system protein